MPSRTIAVTPAPQSPTSPQSPAPDAEASAEYAALLHTAAEAETALRRYEAARGAQLRVPDERRMARLLSDAQGGPMTKEAQRAESERAAAMRMLHLQSEYEAVAGVAANLQHWLDEREDSSRQDGGGVETLYVRGREKLATNIFHAMDTTVEVLNELGSVFFTFTVLLEVGGALFVASLICLGSTVFARLIIALTNWPQVETGTVVRSTLETGYIATKVRTGRDKRSLFLAAVLLYLVEPASGRRVLKGTLRETVSKMAVDGTSMDMHPIAMENTVLFVGAKTEIRTSLSLMVLADLPELTIEVIFLLFFSSGLTDASKHFAFWFSIVGTVCHMIRQGCELIFDYRHLPTIRSHAHNVDVSFSPGESSTDRNVLVEGAGGQNVIDWAEAHGSVCRVLTLTNCAAVDDNVAKAIARNCGQLEKLSAADTRISDAGAREIALASPGLEKLFVNGATYISNCSFRLVAGSQTRLAEQVR